MIYNFCIESLLLTVFFALLSPFLSLILHGNRHTDGVNTIPAQIFCYAISQISVIDIDSDFSFKDTCLCKVFIYDLAFDMSKMFIDIS